MTTTRIVLIGLGPGDPERLTRAAWNALEGASRIFTPTPSHPALAHLPPARIYPLPGYDPACWAMVLAKEAAEGEAIVCALPGHPGEYPFQTFPVQEYSITIIPGLSLRTCFHDVLLQSGHWETQDMQYLDAPMLLQAILEDHDHKTGGEGEARAWCEMQNLGPYEPPCLPFPWVPTRPVLLIFSPFATPRKGCDAVPSPTALPRLIQLRYPPAHPVQVIRLDRSGKFKEHHTFTLHDLVVAEQSDLCRIMGNWPPPDPVAWFLTPLEPLENHRSFEGLQWVIARLLGPNGCPWDREQTFQSLRTSLLEETYEVLEALDLQDMDMLVEELGDLLLQVVLQSEMGRQARLFTSEDILTHLTGKLIRRHPHVFGKVCVRDSGAVLSNWEHIKANELHQKGRTRTSALDGIPNALPALAVTQKLLSRAARAALRWRELEGVLEKLHEELQEFREALHAYQNEKNDSHYAHLVEELGDVLFMVAHVGSWCGVDAESALRYSNRKFSARFRYIEQVVRARGCTIADLPDEEVRALWQEAKQHQQNNPEQQ